MDDWRNRISQTMNVQKKYSDTQRLYDPLEYAAGVDGIQKRIVVSSGIAYTGLGKRHSKRVSALGKGMDFLGVGKRASPYSIRQRRISALGKGMDFLGVGKRDSPYVSRQRRISALGKGMDFLGLGKRDSPYVSRQRRISALGKGMDFMGIGKRALPYDARQRRVSALGKGMDFIGIGKRGADMSSEDTRFDAFVDQVAEHVIEKLESGGVDAGKTVQAIPFKRGLIDVTPTLNKRPHGKIDLGIAYTGIGRR